MSNVSSKLVFPVIDPTTAQSVEQGRNIAIQQLAGKLQSITPQQGANLPQAGAQIVQQAGEQQLQQGQRSIQLQEAQAQQALARRKQEVEYAGAERRLGLGQLALQNENELATLHSNIKNELVDKRMEFEKDRIGRTLFKETQLAEWAVTQAKDAEELKNYQQLIQQASDRNIQLLETAHKKLTQALEMGHNEKMQKLSQDTKRYIAEKKAQIEAEIRKKKAEAAARASIFSGAGSVLGAVAGGIIGTIVAPGVGTVAGAAIGSQAGQGLGSILGATT